MKRAYAGGVVLCLLAACSKDTSSPAPTQSKDVTVAASGAPAAPPPAPAAPAAPPPAPAAPDAAAPPTPTAPSEEPPPPETDDPAAARLKAIEQMETSGVLGAVALQQGGSFASLSGTGELSGLDTADIAGGKIGNDPNAPGFGFGKAGLGPKVEPGRYGTIGHGSGTGSGYGVGPHGGGRGRRGDVPQLRLGNHRCEGDLDKAIVRRYVKRNASKFLYCYEKQLLVKSTLEGTVTAQFVIGGDGAVSGVRATGVHADVSSCVAGVFERIEFPKPKDGGTVQCTYPLSFRPTGG